MRGPTPQTSRGGSQSQGKRLHSPLGLVAVRLLVPVAVVAVAAIAAVPHHAAVPGPVTHHAVVAVPCVSRASEGSTHSVTRADLHRQTALDARGHRVCNPRTPSISQAAARRPTVPPSPALHTLHTRTVAAEAARAVAGEAAVACGADTQAAPQCLPSIWTHETVQRHGS